MSRELAVIGRNAGGYFFRFICVSSRDTRRLDVEDRRGGSGSGHHFIVKSFVQSSQQWVTKLVGQTPSQARRYDTNHRPKEITRASPRVMNRATVRTCGRVF